MYTKIELIPRSTSRTTKLAALLYSLFSYVFFLLTFVYLMGFLGNVVVPKSIDSGLGLAWPWALVVDVLLITVFALQHSIMARKSFKRRWCRVIPPVIERATYVLASSVVLALMCWLWQPIDISVWSVQSPVLAGVLVTLFWLGWGLVLLASFMISHFELFGVKQPFDTLHQPKPVNNAFRTPALYKLVRHPLYLGFLIAFWVTPEMSVGHLVFALTSTIYILIGTQLEEKDLVELFGDKYRDYQKSVGMLLPNLRRKSGSGR